MFWKNLKDHKNVFDTFGGGSNTTVFRLILFLYHSIFSLQKKEKY